MVRLIVTECQERGISLVRTTHKWLKNRAPGQELGYVTIVVVCQCHGAPEAALIFHLNERFLRYSWKGQGLRCQEPRPYGSDEPPPNWNIDQLWEGPLGQAQIEERIKIKQSRGLSRSSQWGRLVSIPSNTELINFGHH